MVLSEITKAIKEIWSFAWPPVILLILVYLIFLLFYKEETKDFTKRSLFVAGTYGKNVDNLRNVLEPYGLVKLVPTTLIILIIVIFFCINGFISLFANHTPYRYSYRMDMILFEKTTPDAKILLLRKYPQAENFGIALLRLSYDLDKSDKKGETFLDQVDPYANVQDFIYTSFLFISFLMFLLPIYKMNWGGFFRGLLKTLLVWIGFIIAFVLCIPLILYQIQEGIEKRYLPAFSELEYLKKDSAPIVPTKEENAKLNYPRDGKWWIIETYSISEKVDWLYKTFR